MCRKLVTINKLGLGNRELGWEVLSLPKGEVVEFTSKQLRDLIKSGKDEVYGLKIAENGIDLVFDEKREDWFDRNFWDRQNYISYGAKTNTAMNAFRNGKPVSNLYVAGSILGGCNPLYEGCGGGLALLTALCAAESILEK